MAEDITKMQSEKDEKDMKGKAENVQTFRSFYKVEYCRLHLTKTVTLCQCIQYKLDK